MVAARKAKGRKPRPEGFFAGKKILVTGGAGFLGHSVVRLLLEKGVRPKDIFVPRSDQYDLRFQVSCAKVVTGQDIVIHLAANAGGIGWNLAHPGCLFYDNIAMGAL
ncbi:MAG: NAD-dependent epimerase/dehydratase family protein, partial [Deltaproteobacteria bacterium]|nr:NAD-dependent epimerase/dehydratase family protein [Deltaproteobacteria bacterium]